MINLEKLNRIPPYQARLFARRRKGRPLTLREIAAASGLSYGRVRTIAGSLKWDDLTVGESVAFMAACGLRADNMWRQRGFLSRSARAQTPLPFISKMPPGDQRIIESAIARHAAA